MDATTWQVFGLTISLVLLVISVLVWRRRGPAAGLRAVGWSLLPAAAGLTGTLRLLWRIGESVVDWAVRLVFSPVVWCGIALAGISLMLLAVSAAMRARGAGRRAAEPGAPERASMTSRRSSPAAQATRRPDGRTTGKPAAGDGDMDDMDNIEAILRKHGIS